MATTEPRPFTPTQERLAKLAMRTFSPLNTWLYRLTGGRVGGRFAGGAPVLLLRNRGRKTGQMHTTPLLYLEDDGRILVVASQGGMSKHPAWYGNVRAHPDVEVEIGAAVRKMQARTASAEEKAAVWPKLVAMYPSYATYQARTDRDIPVVILEPR